MDIPFVIRHRLKELGAGQKELAAAADVTESYISQLLARKKRPPAPNRTDLYEKMGVFLNLPTAELARLADLQRQQSLKQKISEAPAPLFKDLREVVLSKCEPSRQNELRSIFEKEPFGELERLVTQKLLHMAKKIASQELASEERLRMMAELSGRTDDQMRDAIHEFLETDIFHVSVENCVSFLDPLIESWDIDLGTFGMEIVLSHRLALGRLKRFEFVEKEVESPADLEPGFEEFLKDPSLSGDISEEEIAFLRKLQFNGKRPVALYYYRELQNLRDPLHFREIVDASQPMADDMISRSAF